MNKKTVSLSLLVAMAGSLANAKMTNQSVEQKNRIYSHILEELKNSGLSTSDALEILEALQNEIPNKPNKPGPNEGWTKGMGGGGDSL